MPNQLRSFKYLTAAILTAQLTLISACSLLSPATPEQEIIIEPNPTDVISPEATSQAESTSDDSSDPPESSGAPASAERQAINFTTSDGRTLEGYFYPPREENSAIIVLMHWSPGTLDDWNQIALWLQNRKDELTSQTDEFDAMISYSSGESDPWQDPSWFPELPVDFSIGVLTFNFGGRGNSQVGNDGEGLIQDALAAVTAASTLPGIDPHKISTMGASIGAHTSLNSCQLLNQSSELDATCVGVFSLSPGDALGINYDESAALLRTANPSVVIYCLAAASDGSALSNCLSASGENFFATAYEGRAHGMNLITPSFSPSPLLSLLELFEAVYGLDLVN